MSEPTPRRPWVPGLRTSDEGHRVTTFELFFDLVYVFAFTQVSHLMAETHSALGVLQALVVLGFLWWTWCAYSWLANQSPADQGVLRAGMSVAMAAVFVATLAIPEAFDDLPGGLVGSLVLVVAYAIVRLVHTTLYVLAAGDDAALRRQVLRTQVFALLPALALLVVGALVGEPAQTWVWLGAFAWDVVLTWLTSRGGDWRLHSPAHWAERYGLVVILALGESVVAIGVGASHLPVSWPVVGGSVLSIALALVLWWAYFLRSADEAEHRLARLDGVERAGYATVAYTYLHYVLIAGVVLAALGVEEAMAHVDGAEPYGLFGASALAGGVAAYLVGTAVLRRSAGGAWAWWRLAGTAATVALVPVLARVPALTALGLVVLVAYAWAVAEHGTGR
ncbi:low temperature requirement protein A [Cellulomonas sp. ICMP 17802]|uniref:low temperature requirement protein A n=1 Tax=Cellulomonas sp. ICMP 17802 TaxID=3239199 RepID=UPI00351B03BD